MLVTLNSFVLVAIPQINVFSGQINLWISRYHIHAHNLKRILVGVWTCCLSHWQNLKTERKCPPECFQSNGLVSHKKALDCSYHNLYLYLYVIYAGIHGQKWDAGQSVCSYLS